MVSASIFDTDGAPGGAARNAATIGPGPDRIFEAGLINI